MANVTVSGFVNCSDGTVIPVENTSQAEGTEFSLTTNTDFTQLAAEIGTYAPGRTIVSASIQAPNGISFCYVLRQGYIAAILPVSVKGASGTAPIPLIKHLTLQPGDVLRCLCLAATSRNAGLSVYTNRGDCRIFVVTPSGGANNLMTDLQTGGTLGETLNGQIITAAMLTSVDGSKVDGGGVCALDETGMPVGVVPANSPIAAPVYLSSVSIPVALNYSWRLKTSS
jgi:hypothetical protein